MCGEDHAEDMVLFSALSSPPDPAQGDEPEKELAELKSNCIPSAYKSMSISVSVQDCVLIDRQTDRQIKCPSILLTFSPGAFSV